MQHFLPKMLHLVFERASKKLQDTIRELNVYALEKTSPSSVGVALMDEVNQKLGVFSLSRTFGNLLMWTHYADSHKGFVIGLDESHEFFYQRTYQGIKSAPNKISYTTQRSITHGSDPDFYAKLLCEKPIGWAYEEEVRIFRHITAEHAKNCSTDSAGYPVCLFKLPKECIKSIYIGAHAQPGLKENILGLKNYMTYVQIYTKQNYQKIAMSLSAKSASDKLLKMDISRNTEAASVGRNARSTPQSARR